MSGSSKAFMISTAGFFTPQTVDLKPLLGQLFGQRKTGGINGQKMAGT